MFSTYSIDKMGMSVQVILLAIIIAVLLITEPVPQDIRYHNFADTQQLFSIPNFLNIISNLPLLIAGILGIKSLVNNQITVFFTNKKPYYIFFIAVSLVSVGSSYYHFYPDNNTLVWDRLPMTIAFMSLFSIVISEQISEKIGARLLIPFILLGVLSVIYWIYSEFKGNGDLRLYATVQFIPVLVIPLLLIFFKSKFTMTRGYWWLIGSYVVSKILEHFDAPIYSLLILISGHSLKHIMAAIGIYLLLHYYRKRELKPD